MFSSPFVCVSRGIFISIFVGNMIKTLDFVWQFFQITTFVWNVTFTFTRVCDRRGSDHVLNHYVCVYVCVFCRWVSGLEAVAPLLNKGLSYLLHVNKKKRKHTDSCFTPVPHWTLLWALFNRSVSFWSKWSLCQCMQIMHSHPCL